ncbi:ribosome biogenesis GTP-binding protein YihA/YsxC [Mycoplasma phocimorsus]|uniref:ribosome biogenesis GTP-binding protein YihA/YsxC n=1 Tax=Mycoplasma phocimorsus TaxID=3045839 RepID=UPI0024BF828F|nr:ribosome biogenesis GTP-binding protein YihA/YsxC [Mycoplasma phocimorsus]MDJ1646620.1 ribosome biogenesis GTP-binding protein YihA/YsxC [Mycoplasma phocimorsus]
MYKFEKSASSINSFIKHEGSEVVFWGRSNVGKSSLINAIAGSKISKTSSTPGRTLLVNYFANKQKNFLVDLPGYGYAKVNKQTQENITQMIDAYFQNATNIKCVFLLIDSRIGFLNSDVEVINYLNKLQLPIFIVFTKVDKLKQSQKAMLKKWIEKYSLSLSINVSSVTKLNIKTLINIVNNYLYIID